MQPLVVVVQRCAPDGEDNGESGGGKEGVGYSNNMGGKITMLVLAGKAADDTDVLPPVRWWWWESIKLISILSMLSAFRITFILSSAFYRVRHVPFPVSSFVAGRADASSFF